MAEIISTVFEAFAEGPLSLDELLERFPSVLHETVRTLFDALAERRLLQPEDQAQVVEHLESRTELFFWEHSVTGQRLASQLAERRYIVLGVNTIATALVSSLRETGFQQVQAVDVPNLRNLRLADEAGAIRPELWPAGCATPVSLKDFIESADEFDCLVATSDLGGAHLLREWNRFAYAAGVAFFPVVLQNMRGFLGPLSIPGETACYECFRARQNSNMTQSEWQRSSEYVAHETQLGVSSHPAMAASLGYLAALELSKFFVSRIAGWQVGTVYEVDMLDLSLVRRRVLRVPRCSVCDRRAQQSPVSLDEKLFTPHQARPE
jgi:bacteriocin biosynthesis cyclodehydratase domain-containing protein